MVQAIPLTIRILERHAPLMRVLRPRRLVPCDGMLHVFKAGARAVRVENGLVALFLGELLDTAGVCAPVVLTELLGDAHADGAVGLVQGYGALGGLDEERLGDVEHAEGHCCHGGKVPK